MGVFHRLKTAIQIRQDGSIYCKILYGKPDDIIANDKGEIMLFEAGKLVLQFMAWGERKRHIYLYRCGAGEDKIPSVYPHVTLLMEAKTRTRVARIKKLIDWLSRNNIEIESLTDLTLARLQALIEEKKLYVKHIKEVVRNDTNILQ